MPNPEILRVALGEQADKNQVAKAEDVLRRAARAESGQRSNSVRLNKPPSQSMTKKPAQAQGGCVAMGGTVATWVTCPNCRISRGIQYR
eukprot:6203122-Pleurochrysis_carterae.AAC.1